MKELIKASLQDFKAKYLNELSDKLNKEFEYNKTVSETQFLKDLGIKPKTTSRGIQLYEQTKATEKKWREVYNCRFITLDEFKENKTKNKIYEFDKSLEKAIEKVIKKNLNIKTLKLTPIGVGSKGNFELYITDGKKTVNLYTIVAEGEVQTAHYRFLVK